MPEWQIYFRVVKSSAGLGLPGQLTTDVATSVEAETALAAVELAAKKIRPGDHGNVVEFSCHKIGENQPTR